MSLGSIPLLQALPVQQLNVDPRLGGRVEPIIQMNNNSISSTNNTPADTYTMKVLRSSDPQSGHLFHEHTNGTTGEKVVFLQYDKTQKHLSVPQAQKFLSPNHDVSGALAVSGNATILGNLTVGGSFTPAITSLASLDVATLRNTNLTSLNANISSLIGNSANINDIVATNITVDNFISNTLISNLSVDNLFAQDGVMTNLTVVNPIQGTLATYPNTFSSLVATDLTVVNPIQGTLANFPSSYSALTVTNLVADNFTLVNDLNITNLNTSNLTVLNNAELKNVNAFSLSLLDDLKLPINSAEFLKTSSNGFVQSGSFASVTAGSATNVARYDRIYYVSPAGSGDGNVANPMNLVNALAAAAAYNVLNPSHFQALYLYPGEYGNAGDVFNITCSRISIIGLGGYKSVQVVEGFNVNVASVFDNSNENITLENLSLFNQATAGVNCVNFDSVAKVYLRLVDCFVFATGNHKAIDCVPDDNTSRLYLDGCELSADGNMATLDVRRGILWQCSRTAITAKGAANALRVITNGSVSAIDNSVFASTIASVSAQAVVSFEVAGNFIISNSTIQGNAANTDLTGIDVTDNAGVLVANNNQVAIFGTGAGASKALRGTGAGSILYTNANNAVGVAAFGSNTAVAGFTTVPQVVV